MKPEPEILLKTTGLSIGYAQPLFSNLELALRSGELVCFMGPNGIGKSTLIKTLARLHNPLAGSVQLSSQTDYTSSLISVVLTDKVAPSLMTVYELVTYGRYPYINWSATLSDTDHVIVTHSLRQVNMLPFANKKLHELSDGQLQMVMIARALAQQTPIILLDEPTAHLDLNNRVEIMKLLRRLAHTENKAILVSTHELDLALQMADSIWLADKNQSILTGIPEDLILNGTFDDVFQFKGFDLKTGKVQHEAHLGLRINLSGDSGHIFLWTKNALERLGFEVTEEPASLLVSIDQGATQTTWVVNSNQHFSSINTLTQYLLETIGWPKETIK